MKYIRTKDGVYEVVDGFIQLKDQGLLLDHFRDHVIKEADTIKELCDEYVIHFAYGYHLITIKNGEVTFKDGFLNHGFKLKRALENDWEIYGAIWVYGSNGVPTLKSVAKMNDKGELELL